MRPDQLERLRALTEKIGDMVFDEAEFDLWPGAGVPVDQWDKDTRGDRYWLKKNVAATLSLLDRTKSIIDKFTTPDPLHAPPAEMDVDKEIADGERAAAKLIENHMRAFDDRNLGKKH